MVKKVNNRSVPYYRVHLGGRVDAENTRLAEPIGSVPARIIPKMFTQFLTALQERPRGNVYEYVTSQGKQTMMELIQKYATVPPYEADTSFYMDFGKTEEFSLGGLSQAECSSGVVDMIESDLATAQNFLTTSRENNYDLDGIHHAFISASRALLVVKGVDPKNGPEIIDAFITKFVNTRIAPSEFSNLHTVYDQICARKITKEAAYDYTTKLHQTVQEIYSSMDSTFNFPARF